MGWLEVEVRREEMDTAAAAVFGDLEGDTERVRKIQARDEEREWKGYGQGGVLSQRPSAGEQTEYQFEREDQFWQSNRIRKSVDPSSHCLPFCPLHTHLFTVISHLSIPKLSSHFLSPFKPPKSPQQCFFQLLFLSNFRAITFFCSFSREELGNGQIHYPLPETCLILGRDTLAKFLLANCCLIRVVA